VCTWFGTLSGFECEEQQEGGAVEGKESQGEEHNQEQDDGPEQETARDGQSQEVVKWEEAEDEELEQVSDQFLIFWIKYRMETSIRINLQ
jgi:hypothetical protein